MNKNSIPFKNLGWNVLGGGWLGLLIILITPYYVLKIGLDGYGTIAIWSTLQVLMVVFDFGIGSTVLKEMSKSENNNNNSEHKVRLLKRIEIIVIPICILVPILLIFLLKNFDFAISKNSAIREIENNLLILIGFSLAIQFPYGIYFNALLGIQKHQIANILHISSSTLRYVGGAIILTYTNDLFIFFIMQVIFSFIMTLFARFCIFNNLPYDKCRVYDTFRKDYTHDLIKYSLSMAVTSIVAIFVSNIDKFILSINVSLSEFAKYSLALTATAVLQMAIQPIHRVFFPRYVNAITNKDFKLARIEYYNSCKLMTMILIPFSFTGFIFANEIFLLWLNKSDLNVIFVFRTVLIGLTFAAIMWLPAAFQQANGLVWIHTLLMLISIVIGLPLMIKLIELYGIAGGATVWITHGLIEITFGLWVMHKFFFKGEALEWSFEVLLKPLVSLLIIIPTYLLMPNEINKLYIFLLLLFVISSSIFLCWFFMFKINKGELIE